MGLFDSIGSAVGGLFGGGQAPGAVGPTREQRRKTWSNTQNAIKQQKDFIAAVQAQNGLGNQAAVFSQQQALANQLQGMAQGEGPNPALAALNQATGQNVANQAALMAGQRGASANAGLIARQAAQTGSNIQQQSVGQAATMQAQQQLAAIQALQQQQQQMAQLSGTQVGQLQTGLGQLSQTALGQQGNVYGLQQSANAANASINAAQGNMAGNILGGLAGGIGTAIAGPLGGMLGGGGLAGATTDLSNASAAPFAHGGPVQQGPRSAFAQSMYAQGGPVKALVSPGEKYLPPTAVAQVKQGANPMAVGQTIPGKAKVQGDSYANDTIPKTLQEGGIVLPRSVTQSENPHKSAVDFVNALFAKKNMRK